MNELWTKLLFLYIECKPIQFTCEVIMLGVIINWIDLWEETMVLYVTMEGIICRIIISIHRVQTNTIYVHSNYIGVEIRVKLYGGCLNGIIM